MVRIVDVAEILNSNGPMTVREIAEALGTEDVKDVRHALGRMYVRGMADTVGTATHARANVWRLIK